GARGRRCGSSPRWPGDRAPHWPVRRPTPGARSGDVVTLRGRFGVLLAERIGKGIVELLRREADRAVAVGGVVQDREGRPDLRRRQLVQAPPAPESIAMPAAPKPRSSRI